MDDSRGEYTVWVRRRSGCFGIPVSGIWLFFTLMYFFTEPDAILAHRKMGVRLAISGRALQFPVLTPLRTLYLRIRHSRESGNPEVAKPRQVASACEVTGFPLSRE